MLLVIFAAPAVLLAAAVGGLLRQRVVGFVLLGALLVYAAYSSWTASHAGPNGVCDSDLSCPTIARRSLELAAYLTVATVATYFAGRGVRALIDRRGS